MNGEAGVTEQPQDDHPVFIIWPQPTLHSALCVCIGSPLNMGTLVWQLLFGATPVIQKNTSCIRWNSVTQHTNTRAAEGLQSYATCNVTYNTRPYTQRLSNAAAIHPFSIMPLFFLALKQQRQNISDSKPVFHSNIWCDVFTFDTSSALLTMATAIIYHPCHDVMKFTEQFPAPKRLNLFHFAH